MSCYHPLKGFQIGLTDNDKPKYFITSYDCNHVEIRPNKSVVACFSAQLSPYSSQVVNEFIEIPCGRCIGCRLAYSRMWADRCLAEATLHEQSYFVTFTYDDNHIPVNEYIDSDAVYHKSMTLCKRDFQLFMKRLRKNYTYDNKIRFFMAGEYGSNTARPHYHAILFGLKLDDLVLYKKTPLGFNLYTSEFLNKCWNYQGYVIVADVTWETCAYTARYIMKKQTGSASEVYDRYNIIPEFTLMSRKPGIAKDFYDMHKSEFMQFREVNVSTPSGGRKIKSVKYFDKFLDLEYPVEREEFKSQVKEQCEEVKKLKLSNTNMSYLEMLEVEEDSRKNRIKLLQRKEI